MASFCSACGNSMAEGDRFCRVCGKTVAGGVAPVNSAPIPATASQTSGKAVASLICGLLFLFPPVSIVAVVLGHLSLSEIRQSAGRLKGEGLAIAGLVLGYAGLAVIPVLIIAAIAIPNLLRARIAANESSAVAGVRTLVMAEMTYASSHPDTGFTCSLSDLSVGHLISGPLATGQKTGYVFELQNCSPDAAGGANKKFQVVAYPAKRNQGGVRTFCSDESSVIKVDSGGSVQGCLENGETLR